MTLILDAREASDAVLARLHRRLDAVPGRGPAPVVVRTLDSHLSKTALAPLRIATTLVSVSAATALALGMLGLDDAANVLRTSRRAIYAMLERRQLPEVIRIRAPCLDPLGGTPRVARPQARAIAGGVTAMSVTVRPCVNGG
ncbi:MAG TPA: hypothetical protein VMO26_02750 [Vicinamibacterales bacterium]|nr:hypothetical protein [Vicinamibacterales bacterium]